VLRLKFNYLDVDAKKIGTSFLKYLSAGLAAGFIGYASLYFIEPYLNSRTFIGIFTQLAFSTVFALFAFAATSLALKSEEMISLIDATKRKLSKTTIVLNSSESSQL
jgi:hypothetical protein